MENKSQAKKCKRGIGRTISSKKDNDVSLKHQTHSNNPQQEDFEEKWMNAADSHYLRDMILLSRYFNK